MKQEDAGGLFLDEVLDLGVGCQALLFVYGRAPLVDEIIQPGHTRVPLPDPTARLSMVEGMQDSVSIERRIVPPIGYKAVGGLALALEELVPGWAWGPDLEVGAQPDLREHFAHGFRELPVEGCRRPGVQRDIGAVRKAGLLQQLFRLLRIVVVRLDRWVIAKGHRIDDGWNDLPQPSHQPVHDSLPVDGIIRCLARFLLVEGGLTHVKLYEMRAQDWGGGDIGVGVGLQIGDQIGRQVPHNIDATRLKFGDLCGRLWDDPDNEILNRRRPTPVLVKTLHLQILIAFPLDEFIRTGAYRGRLSK